MEPIQELCITEVFDDNNYIIPIYQRNYAWQKDQIEQLLNDINSISDNYIQENANKYYLGSLIVNERGMHQFEVIDGQQRLTTLYLLLCYLKSSYVKKNSLRFEARDRSNLTLDEIFNVKNNPQQIKLDNDICFSEEIVDGYNIIKNYFNEKVQSTENALNYDKFKDKLNNVYIIRTSVPKEIDLNHYFEIMNTRGEQLELHEIAKGRLWAVISKESVDPIDKKIVTIVWDACAQMERYVQMSFDVKLRELIFGTNWDEFKPVNYSELKELFIQYGNNKNDKDAKVELDIHNDNRIFKQSPKLVIMGNILKKEHKWDHETVNMHNNEMMAILDHELARLNIG